MSLSKNLKDLRQQAGLSQGELARRSGISQQLISHIELGRVQSKSGAVPNLAEALGCRPEDLDPSLRSAAVEQLYARLPVISFSELRDWAKNGAKADFLPYGTHHIITDPSPLDRIQFGVEMLADNPIDRVAPPGAVAVFEICDDKPQDGRFYLALASGALAVGRYRNATFPQLAPYSTDPDHETIVTPDGLQAIAQLRRVILDL